MSDQIISRIDDMGSRIDDLEHNINDLMSQVCHLLQLSSFKVVQNCRLVRAVSTIIIIIIMIIITIVLLQKAGSRYFRLWVHNRSEWGPRLGLHITSSLDLLSHILIVWNYDLKS